MASTTSDLTLLGRKLGALDYNPEVYVREIARRSVGSHELLQQRNNIKVRITIETQLEMTPKTLMSISFFADTVRKHTFPTEEECLSELPAIH